LHDVEKAQTLEALDAIRIQAKALREKLESARSTEPKEDDSQLRALIENTKKAEHAVHKTEEAIKASREALARLERQKTQATSGLFDIQRNYQKLQQQLNKISGGKNTIEVDLARIEAHREDLANEIKKEAPESLHSAIKNYTDHEQQKDLWPDIARIKHELEMIGGIDPEIDNEFTETKERHEFLSSQVADLEIALAKTKQAIKELDTIIDKEFDRAFSVIEKGFAEYFGILFNGGKAKLELHRENELDALSEEVAATLTDDEREELATRFRMGITIKASPPNKKVGSISMLSGGERALTSIALICAIIKANPSPFVVLDEVDAALDEANSVRFSEILERLARITQFVAITHNRATMEKASILYGVTMGDDGVSKLLSVDLEKAIQNTKTPN